MIVWTTVSKSSGEPHHLEAEDELLTPIVARRGHGSSIGPAEPLLGREHLLCDLLRQLVRPSIVSATVPFLLGLRRRGCKFERAVRQLQQRVEKRSRVRMPKMGKQVPLAWEGIWAMSESLYRFSTCAAGCPGETRDHTLRYIAGRGTSLALGAVHATAAGYYDNALLTCRALGEQANLVALLVHSPGALRVYKVGDKRDRMRSLGPKAVRKHLAEIDIEPIVSGERAELLSARVVHPSFDEIVVGHAFGAVAVGPMWLEAGFVLCLNEIAIALGGFVFLGQDPNTTEAEREALRRSTQRLMHGVGGLLIDNLPPGLAQPVPEHRWLDDAGPD